VTTSAGGTSATTTAVRWATGHPTSTASATKAPAAFITGQNPIRTGLTKVGMRGADVGLRAEDPTIAELLKPLGYATGHFGKNHLGDKDAPDYA
jgi:arylsulfatase A-like enzyme